MNYRVLIKTVLILSVCSIIFVIVTHKPHQVLTTQLLSQESSAKVEDVNLIPSAQRSTDTRQNETYIPQQPEQPTSNVMKFEGLKFRNVDQVTITEELSPQKAEELFYKFIVQKHIECKKQTRFGHTGDGGWNVCTAGPYALNSPCTVYSFGINNDWSFDDAVSKKHGCKVRAFDPSMKVGEHAHSKLVYFWNKGIAGTNRQNNKGWTLKTLGTLLKDIGDSDKIIDYLKIDVEYNEWEMFEGIFKEHSLRNVKQFAFEIHTHELYAGSPTTVPQFVQYWRTLKTLEDLGFRRWYSHLNPFGRYYSKRTRKQMSCCYELAYVNINFMGSLSSMPSMYKEVTEMQSSQQNTQNAIQLQTGQKTILGPHGRPIKVEDLPAAAQARLTQQK